VPAYTRPPSSGGLPLAGGARLAIPQERVVHRGFVDSDHVVWTVWEVQWQGASRAPRVRAELAGGWLAFQSRKERRRLAPIPEAWDALSDVELECLCRLADAAP